MQTIAAGEFKAKCLGLIDEVEATGKTVIITKRGKPMARLLPFEAPPKGKSGIDLWLLAAYGNNYRRH